jgi:hypothetical protein
MVHFNKTAHLSANYYKGRFYLKSPFQQKKPTLHITIVPKVFFFFYKRARFGFLYLIFIETFLAKKSILAKKPKWAKRYVRPPTCLKKHKMS